MRSRSRALFAITASAALGLAFAAPAGAARVHFSRTGRTRAAAVSETPRLTVVYQNLRLVNGDTATVYSNGLAEVRNADRSQVDYRNIPPASTGPAGTAAALPDKAQLSFELAKAPAQPYVAGQLELVLRAGVRA